MMANRTMTSSTFIIVILGSVFIGSHGVPTIDPTTELVTDFIVNEGPTDMGAEEEYVEEITTLPMDDETVAMTTEESFTTFIPDEEEKGPRIWKSVTVKFTLPDKSPTDIGEPLRLEIRNAINPILKEKFEDYNASSIAFSSGSLIANVKLDFRLRITVEERREVIKVFYEMVERNNTLGSLRVEKLYVLNVQGSYDRIDDACHITRCPSGMTCFTDGNDCTSVCTTNQHYCHHGTCEKVSKRSPFITCHCEEGYTGGRCDKEIRDESEADLYVGIIAASVIACIIVLAILLGTCINLFNKRRIRTGRSEELFGIENVVALELMDEKSHLGGMATQTDESFLLARSHKDGVAPKAGHAHKSCRLPTRSYCQRRSCSEHMVVRRRATEGRGLQWAWSVATHAA
ncbi:uncharacterized protein LOC100891846 isoform X2 [Strongylocentrotus purpuratus]|uniref:EGF-like domain-containing protein n=1 Tax=Strongylocentrotus purpuratus TaxID=7668 RepID=A0A7M7N0I9_STRPU|nr:uncharacterized protein LOC100891846 isoform X2 [Strongylocentrotus purpuratus]